MKTIREIAGELGVSRQSVYKRIKQEPLASSLQDMMFKADGKLVLNEAGEELIKQAFRQDNASPPEYKPVGSPVDGFGSEIDKSAARKSPPSVMIDKTSGQYDNAFYNSGDTVNSPGYSAAQPMAGGQTDSGIIAVLQATIDTLQSQLETKDKQLERQAQTITRLSDALTAAQQTAAAAQALHAGTLQQQLLSEVSEPDPQEPPIEQKPRRGWFRRLFGGW